MLLNENYMYMGNLVMKYTSMDMHVLVVTDMSVFLIIF